MDCIEFLLSLLDITTFYAATKQDLFIVNQLKVTISNKLNKN
jgi:hypothetical protein